MTPDEFMATQQQVMSPEDFQKFQAAHQTIPEWKQAIAKYGPPAAKALGSAVGGVLGGAAGGPVGAAAGGTLGYLGGQEAERGLEQLLGIQPGTTLGEEAKTTAQAIPEAAAANVGGLTAGTLASRGAQVAGTAGKAFLAKQLGLKTEEAMPSIEELGRILSGTPSTPGMAPGSIPPTSGTPMSFTAPPGTLTGGSIPRLPTEPETETAAGGPSEFTPTISKTGFEGLEPSPTAQRIGKEVEGRPTPQEYRDLVDKINAGSELASAPTGAPASQEIPQSEIDRILAGSKPISPTLAEQYGITPESQQQDIMDMLKYGPAGKSAPIPPTQELRDVLATRAAKTPSANIPSQLLQNAGWIVEDITPAGQVSKHLPGTGRAFTITKDGSSTIVRESEIPAFLRGR